MPVILNAPEFVNAMLPLVAFVAFNEAILFVLFNVVPPTELVVRSPGTVNAPDCPIVPVPLVAVIVKLFPTEEAANVVAVLFVKETLFVTPLLLNVIAPVKAFDAFVKVIALAPALKLDVPLTVIVPL